jgi:hypothetical protein
MPFANDAAMKIRSKEGLPRARSIIQGHLEKSPILTRGNQESDCAERSRMLAEALKRQLLEAPSTCLIVNRTRLIRFWGCVARQRSRTKFKNFTNQYGASSVQVSRLGTGENRGNLRDRPGAAVPAPSNPDLDPNVVGSRARPAEQVWGTSESLRRRRSCSSSRPFAGLEPTVNP